MADNMNRAERRFARLNDRLATKLALLAVASAVPLACNRPVWWLFWTVMIAAIGLIYQVQVLGIALCPPSRLRPFAGLFALAAVVPAFALLQSQPWLTAMMPQALRPLGQPALAAAPGAALLAALRLTGYLVLLALTIEACSRRARVRRINGILLGGITLQAIWSLIALRLLGDIGPIGEKTAYLGTATGTFINRNSLATFLGFGLILGLVRLFEPARDGTSQGRKGWQAEDGVTLLAMLFIAIALLATQSRLGVLASVAGLVSSLALLIDRRRRGLGLIVVALAIMGIIGLGRGVLDRAIFTETDGAARLALYRQVVGMIGQRPWTGYGLDGFSTAFEAFRAPPLTGAVGYELAHNSYLTLWAELGVVVGSILPLLLLVIAAMLLGRIRQGRDFPQHAAGAFGVLVLGAIHSLGDFSLEMPANVYLLVVILGMGLARRASHVAESTAVLPAAAAPVPPPRRGALA